jgi:hypothetical protein
MFCLDTRFVALYYCAAPGHAFTRDFAPQGDTLTLGRQFNVVVPHLPRTICPILDATMKPIRDLKLFY